MARADGREPGQLRPVEIVRGFTKHAEGSVLITLGDTRVICTASVETLIPASVATHFAMAAMWLYGAS